MFRTLVIIVTLLVNNHIQSQEVVLDIAPNDHVKITLVAGSEVFGKVLSFDSKALYIESSSIGKMTIKRSQIKEIVISSQSENTNQIEFETYITGERDGPVMNKNFVTETAFTVGEGNWHYQNYMLGANVFTYGVSEELSIGGGFELFNPIQGQSPILLIAPKYKIDTDSDDVHFAVGGNMVLISDFGRTELGASIYGLVTFGNQHHNFTAGIGYGLFDGSGLNRPIFQIGGMTRITDDFMLVADNLLISNDFETALIGTFTIRFTWDRFTLDVGVGTDYNYGAIPVMGAGYSFQ